MKTSSERRKDDKRGITDADRHVSAQLQARRIILGMTQNDLAAVLGITYQQVNKYERGTNRLSAGRIYQAATMLEVDPSYFFEGLDSSAQVPASLATSRHRQQLEMGKVFSGIASLKQRRALIALVRAMAGKGGQ